MAIEDYVSYDKRPNVILGSCTFIKGLGYMPRERLQALGIGPQLLGFRPQALGLQGLEIGKTKALEARGVCFEAGEKIRARVLVLVLLPWCFVCHGLSASC